MHYEYQDIKYPHKNNTVQKLRDINLTAYTTSGEELRHIIARCYTRRNIRHIWHPESFPKHYITVCYDTMIPCPSDRYQGCGNFLQSYCNSDCWIQQSKQASSLKHQIKRNFWSKCLRLNLIRIHSRHKMNETTRWYYLFLNSTSKQHKQRSR